MEVLLSVVLGILLGAGALRLYRIRMSRHQFLLKDVLLEPEALARHAREVAKFHRLKKTAWMSEQLGARVKFNRKVIDRVYRFLYQRALNNRPLPPASQWLLDNNYIIEAQAEVIQQNYSWRDSRNLPLLSSGPLRGFPRAYAIALEIVSHTDGHLTKDSVRDFVTSYQDVARLSSAELWSLPTFLRAALFENIRILSEQLRTDSLDWDLIEQILTRPDAPEHIYRESFSPVQLEHLIKRIRLNPHKEELLASLEDNLNNNSLSLEQMVQEAHQIHSARSISLGNSISSLKQLSTLNWNLLFEEISPVVKVLSEDPIYLEMDFKSRSWLRSRVEYIAKKYRVPETRVARAALECTQTESAERRHKHTGWYLAGKGQVQLFSKLGLKPRQSRKAGISLYLLAILGPTILTSLWLSNAHLHQGLGMVLTAALISVIPVSELVVTLLNWAIVHSTPPDFLPRLELKTGIPGESATVVVVPALLTDARRAEDMATQLEVHWYANGDDNLWFALLGDFKDSDRENEEDDKAIITAAQEAIGRLNQRHGHKFFYLHRKRVWSPQENRWLGRDRKRGILGDFNRLLRDDDPGSFVYREGNLPDVKIRYVLTLDADTRLPINMARRLIGTISHPLNQALTSENSAQEGYGLIQPLIKTSIVSSSSTLFSEIMAGAGGIDSYSGSVSNVYQDLFGEGIFTGKGIYDVDVFLERVDPLIHENTVLSHDLLEGSLARTGLASDLELVDDFPSQSGPWLQRLHRWTRGDWQLLPWLFSQNLSLLSRWKIADNLRRSLVHPSLLLLIFWSLLNLPSAAAWSSLVLLVLTLPMLLELLDRLIAVVALREQGSVPLVNSLRHGLLNFCWLPWRGYLQTDAAIRSIWRVYVSKKRLLEWTTAAEAEKNTGKDRSGYRRWGRLGLLLAGLLVSLTIIMNPSNIGPALGFGFLWGIAPRLTKVYSKPRWLEPKSITSEDLEDLRTLARKSWLYYDDLATEEHNFLPPDNYQTYPPTGSDYRTSPTNIGFCMAGVVSARDFGFITTSAMVRRLEQIVDSLEKMDKWHGHLYNWYDTRTLAAMRPLYVSTVDSGNLLAMLLSTAASLAHYANSDLIDDAILSELSSSIPQAKRPATTPSCRKPEAWLELVEPRREQDPILDEIKEEIENLLVRELLKPEATLSSKPLYSQLLQIAEAIQQNTSLKNLAECYNAALSEIGRIKKLPEAQEEQEYLAELSKVVATKADHIQRLLFAMNDLGQRIEELISQHQFSKLYDTSRDLFSIGYDAEAEVLSDSYYDLLASEARLTSYLAIARREVPWEHWFRLGRAVTKIDGDTPLVSWAGTMFEYLMPQLLLPSYRGTLLDSAIKGAIAAQIRYGKARGIPWGISESGYYGFDLNLNYQYRAFGIPDLGFKRGLSDDLVVSPYSTLLTLPYNPLASLANIKRLQEEGLDGKYGLYEAVDYTPNRLPQGRNRAVVRQFMAHHQGMGLVALNNYCNHGCMIKRFSNIPLIKGADLLLQERQSSRLIKTKEFKEPLTPLPPIQDMNDDFAVNFKLPDSRLPQCQFLGNGEYSVLITDRGTGYSSNGEVQITRWRRDPLATNHGSFILLREPASGRIWSATYAPIPKKPEWYRVNFSADQAIFSRSDGHIDTRTTVTVATEDKAEIRQVTLINHSTQETVVELTSYQEIVLTHRDNDLAHPAFSKLFVYTEALPEQGILLACRKPRSAQEQPLWAVHAAYVGEEIVGPLQYETARPGFLGRNRDIAQATLNEPLQGSAGAVLDPIFCLRFSVRLSPGSSTTVAFITGVAADRDSALQLATKYNNNTAIQRAIALTNIRSQVEKRYHNLLPHQQRLVSQLTRHLVFPSPNRGSFPGEINGQSLGQPGLWQMGISGDIPIMVLNMTEADETSLLADAISAQVFLRSKGLLFDLVVICVEPGGYLQPVHEAIESSLRRSWSQQVLNQRGGIYVLKSSQLMPAQRNLLFQAASVLLHQNASLDDQLTIETPQYPEENEQLSEPVAPNDFLTLPANGLGEFSEEGNEYRIVLNRDASTPAPWINVLANPQFGTFISESGGGYTWAENSRENKLTPWSNDPIRDPLGEQFWLRDEESGVCWTVTPRPLGGGNFKITHRPGSTGFSSEYRNIASDLLCFVDIHSPVKFNLLRLANKGTVAKTLTVTGYVAFVLGVNEDVTRPHLHSRWCPEPEAILVNNNFSSDFPGRTAFFACSQPASSYTADRHEFLGFSENRIPSALKRAALEKRVGKALDPCGAIQAQIVLAPGQQLELVFVLGQGINEQQAVDLAREFANLDRAKGVLAQTVSYWQEFLGQIQVQTPDPALNYLVNTWLPYQTLVCRLWARTAFYQAGGAYGFRDQLQDAANIAMLKPDLLRKQIVLHAAHQYLEGDVQHWWHPGLGRGVRTRFSDDRLWLPWAVARYVKITGDHSLLEEETGFLTSEPLAHGHDERYEQAQAALESASIWTHCIRAIECSLSLGKHDIPLMGSGDWNDGMNTVGHQGQGESVWLGWFLASILLDFASLAEQRQEQNLASRLKSHAYKIAEAIEEHAWDGDWYLRAWFDDGTPLGAKENSECFIDSLAQSWSVISGLGNPSRIQAAMAAVWHHLVRNEGLVLLFTPPFANSDLEPGYIKGYLPGVRENGGQYTHAACWVIMAETMLGRGAKAHQLWQLISPISHTKSWDKCQAYKTEPYAIAADVYSVSPNSGRGGWTWYTGASGWLWRVGVEHILGLRREGNILSVSPCIPADWRRVKINFRHLDTVYKVTILNPWGAETGVRGLKLDGVRTQFINLVNDGAVHRVTVLMGPQKTGE